MADGVITSYVAGVNPRKVWTLKGTLNLVTRVVNEGTKCPGEKLSPKVWLSYGTIAYKGVSLPEKLVGQSEVKGKVAGRRGRG